VLTASRSFRHSAASISTGRAVPGSGDVQTIPPIALAAYQRATVVIDASDTTCHLDWELLAAVGQVESDHGRAGGSRLDDRGVARPPIIGLRLDGKHATSRVVDTDGGVLDRDRDFDRAVGPLQFLPSTWAAVAVDGDADGRRDVQDIDDAALGSAVYLCSGGEDLSTGSGRRSALLRYNHSGTYVAQVLAAARQLSTSSIFGPPSVRTPGVQQSPPRDQPTTNVLHPAASPAQASVTDVIETESPVSPVSPVSPASDPGPAPSHEPSQTPTPSATPTPTPTPTLTPTPTPTDTPSASPTTDPTDPTTDPTTEPTRDPTTDPTPDPSSPEPGERPAVLPDPLPPELAHLSAEQVQAYDAAWLVCAPEVETAEPWAEDATARESLGRCLAVELGADPHDPALVVFVDWIARHEEVSHPEGARRAHPWSIWGIRTSCAEC
jgi:hypothetical protein